MIKDRFLKIKEILRYLITVLYKLIQQSLKLSAKNSCQKSPYIIY